MDGKCVNRKTCWNRHPKHCKYFKGDGGCRINESCKYLHNQGAKVNADVFDKVIKEKDVDTIEMDVGIVNESKVDEMERLIASKDKTIK